jgi:hypothetical protein
MEAGVAAARGPLPALAAVLLLRLPFLDQPIQGDDDIYRTEADASSTRFTPATKYVFLRRSRSAQALPPLNAGLCRPAGGNRRDPRDSIHAAYIAFSLIAVVPCGRWRGGSRPPSVSHRCCSSAPAFVVNAMLESDLLSGSDSVGRFLRGPVSRRRSHDARGDDGLPGEFLTRSWAYGSGSTADAAPRLTILTPSTVAAWQIFLVTTGHARRRAGRILRTYGFRRSEVATSRCSPSTRASWCSPVKSRRR